jgi:hypothetical protein
LTDSNQPQWWFNMSTKMVEFGLKSKALDRIGPFASEAEASNALEKVKERNRDWLADERSED